MHQTTHRPPAAHRSSAPGAVLDQARPPARTPGPPPLAAPGPPPRPARGVRIGMLSTYPPTQCGLATFDAALREHLAAGGAAAVDVVRVVDQPETHPGPEVVAHLVNGSPASAARAVAVLDGYDAVVVQHEYGIYGGPDGRDILDLLEALSAPLVVVLHTVLTDPSASQRSILQRILARAEVVVTMTETARARLLATYGADPSRVTVIPHGAIDHGPGPEGVTAAAPSDGAPTAEGRRPVVLTWGLLGPGKGVEWALEAVAGLRDLAPRYLVVGKTHPKVLEHAGDAYRDGLRTRIAELGVGDLVELDASYLDLGALAALVRSADVVLLPYDSRDQVTSGVLIEAIAAGRPVVSTAFPHAVELLDDGPGLTVPQADPAALEAALRRVLTEPGLAASMAAAAAAKAPDLLWGAVAARYRAIAEALAAAHRVRAS